MGVNVKGHLLLLSLVLVLSLAQQALAHYSWHSEEDDWYNNFRKPKVYGGRKFYKKKYGGFYNGKPFYDDDDDGEESSAAGNDGDAAKPYKFSPVNKPYFKYKPKSLYKPHPTPYTKAKPIYTKAKPDTQPDAQPTPYTKPSAYYKKKKPSSYYRKPVPQYVLPEHPDPTVPETPAPETPTTYTSPASSSEKEWLDPHNAARAEVGLPPMVWSDEVAQFAQSWANQRLASGCGLEHSGGPYGENIFWGSAGGYGPAECVAAWVNEKQYYSYGDNSCADGQDCGHYTQIIWANSVRLGCAKVQCPSGDVFMTCNYDPPGNYIGTKPY